MTAPVVIKLGGRALDEASSRPALWDAIATIAQEAPGGLVVVHGGGGAVDAHLAALGMTTERREGLRITPESQIDEVVAVLRGRVNTRLVGLLVARGVRAVGLGLSDGGACVCQVHRPGGVDLGRVGVAPIEAQDPGCGVFWRSMLGAGTTPIIASIGLDHAGEPLNVNADDAALAVAAHLEARALVLLTDVAGIRDADGSTVPEIDARGIEDMIRSSVIAGGMIPKARAAAQAARVSGVPVVIASWERPERLPEICAGRAGGTRVVAERRPAGAAG